MTNLKDNLYAVEVPEGSINFVCDMGYLIFKQPNYKNWVTNDQLADYGKLMKHLETHKEGDDYKTGGIPLPAGSYEFLFCTKDATEEEAKDVVDSAKWHFPEYHVVYVNYAMPVFAGNRQGWNEAYNNAIASLRSLLASKGLGKPNYAILKKVG